MALATVRVYIFHVLLVFLLVGLVLVFFPPFYYFFFFLFFFVFLLLFTLSPLSLLLSRSDYYGAQADGTRTAPTLLTLSSELLGYMETLQPELDGVLTLHSLLGTDYSRSIPALNLHQAATALFEFRLAHGCGDHCILFDSFNFLSFFFSCFFLLFFLRLFFCLSYRFFTHSQHPLSYRTQSQSFSRPPARASGTHRVDAAQGQAGHARC